MLKVVARRILSLSMLEVKRHLMVWVQLNLTGLLEDSVCQGVLGVQDTGVYLKRDVMRR